jgi:aryl-alcohol dehydrogenase-like predicted oxidoreductase
MEYRPLGRTGISVSQMCLGAMMFGAFGNSDHDDAAKIIHKALDAGINFIDTADGYSAGESEEILGKALADGRRESVVLAVKFGREHVDSAPALLPRLCGGVGVGSGTGSRPDLRIGRRRWGCLDNDLSAGPHF